MFIYTYTHIYIYIYIYIHTFIYIYIYICIGFPPLTRVIKTVRALPRSTGRAPPFEETHTVAPKPKLENRFTNLGAMSCIE